MTNKLRVIWSMDGTQDMDAMFSRRPCIFAKTHERVHQWAYRTHRHDAVIGSWWYRMWGCIPNPFARKTPNFVSVLSKNIQEEIDQSIVANLCKKYQTL
jgi:hypothetical protein